MKKIKYLIAIVFLAFLSSSCDKAEVKSTEEVLLDMQGDKGFVGPVFGTNAYVAVLVSNEDALVYVCNGDEQISEWFKVPISDMINLNLTNSAGASIVAKFNGTAFEGQVTLKNSTSHEFSAGSTKSQTAIVQRAFGEQVELDNVSMGWVFFSKKDSDDLDIPDERGAYVLDGIFQNTPILPSGSTSITIDQDGVEKTYKVKQWEISRTSANTASIISVNG